jgi:hypothetical protein
MRLRPIKPKPPGYRTAQLVLVPVIAALLALNGLIVACNDKENSWNSPRNTPSEAPVLPARRLASEIQTTPTPATFTPDAAATRTPGAGAGTGSPSQETLPTSVGSPSSTKPSDQQEQQNFSARPTVLPESIQNDGLTPCQRSAAACFGVGGLDSLLDNLDGIGTQRGNSQFCFEFQDGCERR